MTGTDRYGTADQYGLLDPRDLAEVERYERHFYDGYAALTDNRLVRRIWDWDDGNRRLRTRIPYRDQVIYRWSDPAGQPIVYLAVNLGAQRAFQAGAFGFAPGPAPGDPERGHYCEVLNVLRVGPPRRATASDYRDFVRDYGFRDLARRGFTVAYATCTRRRLRPYLLLGAQLVQGTALDGEERFLLRWPLLELLATARASAG
jgi:hypothetical protein